MHFECAVGLAPMTAVELLKHFVAKSLGPDEKGWGTGKADDSAARSWEKGKQDRGKGIWRGGERDRNTQGGWERARRGTSA